MEADRFDALLRSLASRSSRRAFTSLPIVGSLAVLLGHAPEVASKKRKKKKCKGGATRCGKACVDSQSDPAHCGGCNQACTAGASCRNGSCQTGSGGCNPPCPTGSTCVNGACQPDSGCNPPCPADRPCFKGFCLCTGDGQCARDKDPGGQFCNQPTDGDPLKVHCGCSRDQIVCTTGESCSNCCTTAACILPPLNDSFVCPSVPPGSYRGRFCCIDNDKPCSSNFDCCSNRCSANVCACGGAGLACTNNTGCCSGTCSGVTGLCV